MLSELLLYVHGIKMLHLTKVCRVREKSLKKRKRVECPTQINENILYIYSKGQAVQKHPSPRCNKMIIDMTVPDTLHVNI